MEREKFVEKIEGVCKSLGFEPEIAVTDNSLIFKRERWEDGGLYINFQNFKEGKIEISILGKKESLSFEKELIESKAMGFIKNES